LFEVEGVGEIHDPLIISDPYGNVHVFWTVIDSNSALIYYTRLDATGWTAPIDIVAAGTASAPRAVVGQDGFIYLVWYGSNGTIKYSRALVNEAEFAGKWFGPYNVTSANIRASLATSPSGPVYLAFPGQGNAGVFIQSLDLRSLSWSSPKIIAWNSLIDTAADYVQMKISSNGTLHAVWTEFYYPESWPPRGVFYSRSTDRGDTWSIPMELGGDGYDQVNIAVVDDDNIHVAWNGMAGVGGRYHRWSSDGGQTWTETIGLISPGIGGTEGLPQLVVDQAGTLHLLTTYSGCAWHTYFDEQKWATPVCISGEKARASNYMEEPAMTVSEGNKLHAVFWDDRKRLWYTSMVSSASWIPPETLDNVLVQPTPNLAPTDFSIVTPSINTTNFPDGQNLGESPRFVLNTGQILLLGLVPAILLILLVVVIRFSKTIR
jgi:hypothetical protein